MLIAPYLLLCHLVTSLPPESVALLPIKADTAALSANLSHLVFAALQKQFPELRIRRAEGPCTRLSCVVEAGHSVGANRMVAGRARQNSGRVILALQRVSTPQGLTFHVQDLGADPSHFEPGVARAVADLFAEPCEADCAASSSAEFFADACQAADASACSRLGTLHLAALAAEQAATAAFTQACRAGADQGCLMQGRMFAWGDGVAQDDARAASLYQRACEQKNAIGCLNLAMAHEAGKGVPQALDTALGLYEMACERGETAGCGYAGRLLSVAAKPDYKRAVALLSRACDDRDAHGCTWLAELYRSGQGVKRSETVATLMLQRACAAGGDESCQPVTALSADGDE